MNQNTHDKLKEQEILLKDAINNEKVEEIELLMKEGININHKDAMGWTPLHQALYLKKEKAAKILFENGADIYIKDGMGKTAVDIMRENRNMSMNDISFMVLEQDYFIKRGTRLIEEQGYQIRSTKVIKEELVDALFSALPYELQKKENEFETKGIIKKDIDKIINNESVKLTQDSPGVMGFLKKLYNKIIEFVLVKDKTLEKELSGVVKSLKASAKESKANNQNLGQKPSTGNQGMGRY
jgi:hypothetical protein